MISRSVLTISKSGSIVMLMLTVWLSSLAAEKPVQPVQYSPLTYRDAEWYGSTFWTGPDWTRVGKDWHHPGHNTPSVRRFEAPRDGRLNIEGRVFKLHLSGDGIRACIRHNDREIWKVEIEGKDEKGIEPKLILDVKKGDSLRFVVEKRGNIGCDTTGWDPVITYADGKRFQASESFAKKKQGTGNWFYEMEGTGPIAPPIVASTKPVETVTISPVLQAKLAKLAPTFAPKTGPALLAMVLEAWWREDKLEDTAKSYECAFTNHLVRAIALAKDLGVVPPSALSVLGNGVSSDTLDAWRSHYLKVRLLKRELALGNPLLHFDELLICKRAMPSWSHLVAQYFGWRQRGGGGLYALRKPGYSLETRNIVGSQLPTGSYLEPRLSYDGKRILFSFVACDSKTPSPASLTVNEAGQDERYFHLYEIGIDGTGLRNLTSGTYDDMMAEYLPDGGIVFVSTRRRGYSRCFGPEYSQRWHTYTLHRADGDGSNIRILSWNDVSEWFPAVSSAGQILFARWDYIDRDAVTHQNLWSCRPDGSNPMAVWGNALPSPHCTFQAKPIPDSQKLVFIASAHHAVTAGPVCLLDPTIGLNAPEAVERVTPLKFPEAEGPLTEWYESPWPLSENYFLVAYSPFHLHMQGEHASDPNPDHALGVYLLDRHGNRELLYRDPVIGATTPIPIAVRPAPPVLASHLPKKAPLRGEMMVYDIYKGLSGVPRGAITAIRIVQIFPKTTYVANTPRIGLAGEENGRAILGTVPVEPDGSARFLLPAGKKVLFQAIDQDGFARRIMRSSTYVQPGEVTSCTGCHEYGATTRPIQSNSPMAMQRQASAIEPGPFGGRPFSFVEVVQPVLDRHCMSCHGGDKPKGKRDLTRTPHNGFTRSYWSLCNEKGSMGKDRQQKIEAGAEYLVPRYFQRNQIQITPADDIRTARRSRLMRMFLDPPGHNNVKLSGDDVRRLALWIDLNAIFYGVYDSESQALQLAGQAVAMPEIQ
ncbi:MAG: hypothetical protein PHR77_03510 [Kiritimatiellae bacterium]|nr:hypothetical protein [Kiritimatiellia bacterium]MDD5522038.1 hypothetical protein [Kiritimatiellia bacterium]